MRTSTQCATAQSELSTLASNERASCVMLKWEDIDQIFTSQLIHPKTFTLQRKCLLQKS